MRSKGQSAIGAFVVACLVVSPLLSSCGLMELGGKITRVTGEAMTDYSKKDDSIVRRAAGFGGSVNTAAGTVIEDAARKGNSDNASGAKSKPSVASSEHVALATSSSNAGESNLKDNRIHAAQARLRELGYDARTPDGVMGTKTKSAIRQYQGRSGLPVTGILDQTTMAALGLTNN